MSTVFSSALVDTAEHHALLRDSVGKLAGRFGRRYFQDLVKRHAKPNELWQALGEAGYLGVHVPEQYGGGGSGLADYNVIVEEVAAQGCPILSLVINSICSPIIEQHGSESLKQAWLPGLASGKKRLSFAITEPNAGTNTHKITTTARQEGQDWVIQGNKYWTSGLDEADSVMVVCREEKADERGRHPLSLFIVPAQHPGISRTPIEKIGRAHV